jgi:hypothetical protein
VAMRQEQGWKKLKREKDEELGVTSLALVLW